MRVTRFVAIALAVAVPCFRAGSAARGASYFVSPQGTDTNPGTLERPFATLHRAQQAARQAQGREPVTVYLRGGTYYLPETLTFTAEDSATKAAPVVYQAYQNQPAVISGGVRLNHLKWQPYREGIMKAAVPAGFATDQLFVNGQRQPMARYPDFNPEERIYNGYAADAFAPERTKRWADPRGGFIHAMHSAEWGGFHFVITGKKADGTVAYEGGWQNNRPSGMHGRYRFVENVFEELDAPGEWFLDGKTGTLYFYPPAGVDLDSATVEAVRLRHLIEYRGTRQAPVRCVTLKGLTFRHAARTFMENKEPLVRSDWTTYRGGALFLTGTEDCSVEDCFIDQVGGNAVFVNHYNRRLTVRGCHVAKAGANGVAFVGDRDAARVPRDWSDRSQKLATLDRTPGPKTDNYPADCLLDDCLIYLTGRVEKQTAPVQIELSQGITVRHCSLYDVPRAGINIGDGCWGGHVIEFCDVFDTVKETGDHGSFNSWGRDRFWGLSGLDLNHDRTWQSEKDLPLLDAVKTVVMRNNRWRCDHGWDIDLDDGSSNYHLYNNLCLRGGIKNREGFHRVVENNIMVDNGFHPHVWFKHSQDVVRRNLMWSDAYLPAGGMPSAPWGKEMDDNLVHRPGATTPKPATKLAEQSQRDARSIVADAMFVDPAAGDYRVRDGSPALKLGFVNFPMDRFGVQKPQLKAIARTPELPKLKPSAAAAAGGEKPDRPWFHRLIVGTEVGPTGVQWGGDPADSGYAARFNGRETPAKYQQAFNGAHKVLAYSHVPYGVVLDENAAAAVLRQYPILLLPNAAILSPAEVALLEQYVEAGGNLIVTGHSGLWGRCGEDAKVSVLERLIGAKLVEKLPALDNHVRLANLPAAYGRIAEGIPANWPFLVQGPAAIYRPTTAVPLGELLKPHRTLRQRKGQEGTTFPNSADAPVGPAVLVNRVGKGKVVCLACSPDFATAGEYPVPEARLLLRNAVRWLDPQPPVEIDAPLHVESVVSDDARTRTLRVHLIGYLSPPACTPPNNRPFIIPPMVEEAPLYRATITLRRPIREVKALNKATLLETSGSRIAAQVNDIHDVLVIRY